MLHGAPTMDSIFLPLKMITRQGSNPLHRSMRAFLAKVNELLGSRKNLPEQAATLRDEQFALRIRAMRWVLAEGIDLREQVDELEARMQRSEADDEHGVLLANMRFALHAQREVLGSLKKAGADLNEVDAAPLEQLGDLQFSQFESALLVGVPNQEAAQVLLGWLHASMDMEVAMLMADAVLNNEVRITSVRMAALNRYLVNATQTYAGSARLLGVVRAPESAATLAAEPLPAAWTKSQQRMADLGLGDWLRL